MSQAASLAGRPGASTAGTAALLAVLTVSGAAALLATGGDFLPLFGGALALIAAAAFWRAPLRVTLRVLFLVALVVDVPQERPAAGMWRSPLAVPGAFLFDNLNKLVGVDALRLFGLDLVLAAILALVALRWATGSRADGPVRTAAGLRLLTVGTLLALLALEAWGMVRGGHFKNSLWQLRQVASLPVLALLFAGAVRDARDAAWLGRLVVLAACVKAAFGAWVYFAVARPLNVRPDYVTTHSDTVLFVSALAVLVAAWAERPTPVRTIVMGVLGAWIGLAVVMNNRRLAFVSLAACLGLVYAMLRGPVKRSMTRVVLAASPLLALYVLAGTVKTTGVFSPAAKIVSVIQQKDRSSGTRDIENYNLVQTLKAHPLVGSGFGHEYLELSKADDISRVFPLYRYIGHNSVLWLWSVAGVAGFTAAWMLLPATLFFAFRAHRFARTRLERTAAASAACVIVTYVLQAYGDMGLQSWVGAFLVAAAVAVVGNLAVVTGAWRSVARVPAAVTA